MSIDLGNTPTGTPPTQAEKEQICAAIGMSDAIVATADGKYPALDGSLIANVVGEQGLQGIQGLQGEAGETGATGADSTIAGPQGETGPQGPTGPQGAEGLMPNVDNVTTGPAGPAGVVEGLDDILARITSLEQYSPLTNVSNGAVSDITYKNKEEITLGEKLQNITINSEGGSVPWTPDMLPGMQLWLDASDLTSIGTSWTDKSGNVNIVEKNGNPTLVTDTNSGLKMIHYSVDTLDNHELTNTINGINTVFWVFNDTGPRPRANNEFISILGGPAAPEPFYRDNYGALWKWNQGLGTHETNKAYINGLRGTDANTQFIPTTLSVLCVKSEALGAAGFPVTGFGTKYGAAAGFEGNLGELILFDSYLSEDDITKVEGYLSHKWNLNSDLLYEADTSHPHLILPPMNDSGVIVEGWSKSSGMWDPAQLQQGILQGNGMPVSIKQSVETLPNEIYDVNVVRADENEALVIKLSTDVNVKWLSHADDITDTVDVPFNTVARFQVIGNETPTYIEVDTINDTNQITSMSMIHKKIANGAIEVLTNNTIKKTAGVDGWNAGTSSTEFISGQGEGYVQFQMGQSGKAIKVGLIHNDVDYVNTAPYEMLFFESSIQIQGVVRDTYVSGDWFRIKHDSVNNQIVYQKRDSNLDYQTIYSDTLTTDGRNLYLDTSFFHLDGRINDVSLIN